MQLQRCTLKKADPLPSICAYAKNIKTALALCEAHILRNNQYMPVSRELIFLAKAPGV